MNLILFPSRNLINLKIQFIGFVMLVNIVITFHMVYGKNSLAS